MFSRLLQFPILPGAILSPCFYYEFSFFIFPAFFCSFYSFFFFVLDLSFMSFGFLLSLSIHWSYQFSHPFSSFFFFLKPLFWYEQCKKDFATALVTSVLAQQQLLLPNQDHVLRSNFIKRILKRANISCSGMILAILYLSRLKPFAPVYLGMRKTNQINSNNNNKKKKMTILVKVKAN